MPIPVDVRTLPSKELLVTWNDGERSIIQERLLRYYCPCAQCVDERTGKRMIQWEQVPESVHIESMEAVGRYAIRFTWSDRHSTGIYSFDYLNSLQNLPSKQ